MAKDKPILVKDAIFKLQLSLLEGIQNEDLLFAAGSLMSRSDYEDVVTERSIINICGYPLCHNPLPSDRPRKGRYRISLREHKVYDLHETYMYCSSGCVVNSKAFAESLQDERCSVLDPNKVENILRLFDNISLEPKESLGKDGNSGLSGLKIQEKAETNAGELSLEQWVGPSNAIEGYVPKQRDRNSKGSTWKNNKKGSKASNGNLSGDKHLIYNEMDFMSTIITQDEYSVSKVSSGKPETTDHQIKPAAKVELAKGVGRKMVEKDDSIEDLSSSLKSTLNLSTSEEEEPKVKGVAKSGEGILRNSLSPGKKKVVHLVSSSDQQCDLEQNDCERKSIQLKGEMRRVATNDDATGSCKMRPKSCLKSSSENKPSRSVTWADEKIKDEKINGSGSNNLSEVKEFGDIKKESDSVINTDVSNDEDVLRCASAGACAIALSQASEAVASGHSDVTDAVSESGIILLPPPHDAGGEGTMEEDDMLERDGVTLKWPIKPGISDVDLFDSEDSWYDIPPEGFSLTLSPFATMWNALFSWITSSSLAYIYGRDESFHEEYLSVNGREYPHKIVLEDGRSSEIKQTLASCLARALPALVAELRLPIPISTLEQGMARLLDTMSFVDAIPAFRTREWQVVVLSFIDALSISRIPALIPYMTDRRVLFHKVLNGTQIGMEEYEVLKDLIIPLGRAPNFSAQSGA